MSSGDENNNYYGKGGNDKLALGFDVGSVALKVVVTNQAGEVLHASYDRTYGRPLQSVVDTMRELLDRYGSSAFDLVAGTGSAGRRVAELLGVPFVNEVICQATAIRHLQPEVRSPIEMGGQDSKLILLPEGSSNGAPADPRPMVDFSMNTNCAAGTGSFLDQQASRLGVPIEGEFGELGMMLARNLRANRSGGIGPPRRVALWCCVASNSGLVNTM